MGYCSIIDNPLDRAYHDAEWGVPLHDERLQFEYLMMEVMQCGLSWILMLKKRDVFRRAFDGFDYDRIAAYTERDVSRILAEPGMIRSRRKVEAVIHNARVFRSIRAEAGSFDAFLWGLAGGRTILYAGHATGRLPAANALADRIAAELRRRGMKYLGPVTVYAHLQACGIVNDHEATCPRYAYINANFPTVRRRRDGDR